MRDGARVCRFEDISRRFDLVRLLGVDGLEVLYVPGVNDFSFDLRGATEKKSVRVTMVERLRTSSTERACSGGITFLTGSAVMVAKNFRQRVQRAGGFPFIGGGNSLEAGVVIDVSKNSFMPSIRADALRVRVDHSSYRSLRRFGLVDQDAPLFFEESFGAHGPQRDFFSLTIKLKSVARAKPQLLTQGFGDHHASSLVESKFAGHIGNGSGKTHLADPST
jgi:hypothetical protein